MQWPHGNDCVGQYFFVWFGGDAVAALRWIHVLSGLLAIPCAMAQPAVKGGTGQAPVKVALVVPLSGTLRAAGPDIVAATQAWAAEKNAANGLRGRKLDVRVYDDESSADGAKRAAARAIAERVDIFLSCFGTVACMQIAGEARSAEVALLGPIAGAEVLRSAAFANVFATRPAASGEMGAIFRYLSAIGQQNATVIYQDDGFGNGYREALAKSVEAIPGMRIRNQFPIDIARRNFDDVAARVVASGEGFGVVLLSNTPNSVAMIDALEKKGFRGISFNLAAQANAGFVSAMQEKLAAQNLVASFVTTAPPPNSQMPPAILYRAALERWAKDAKPGYVGLEAFINAAVLEKLVDGFSPERVEATLKRHPDGGQIARLPMSYDVPSRSLRGWLDIAVVSKNGQIRHQ